MINENLNILFDVCPLSAPVPVWGAEEAAVAGHGTDHPTGQQLVSALPDQYSNSSSAALSIIS